MASDSPRPSTAALGTLFTSSGLLAALGAYQWYELLGLRDGKAPACAINETVNCATVWNSPFAARVQDLLGMPVAALGVIYGLVGLALALLVWWRSRAQADAGAFLAGAKVWAAIGVLCCVSLGAASFQAGAICVTCLGTYALTAVYAFGALRLLPGPLWPDAASLAPGAAWALVLTVPVYLCLLVPGARTPKSGAARLQPVAKEGLTSPADLEKFIDSLPPRDKSALAAARAEWIAAEKLDNREYPVRLRRGPADAPVRIVDFTDIRCPHCRTFDEVVHEIERVTPEGTVSVEARYFPLDSECNPQIQSPPTDGVRCLAAQVQICLEADKSFGEVRKTLFDNQQALTRELVLQTASSKSGLSIDALQTCAASAETRAKLYQDIEYAMRYHLDGTPLVLINDKMSPAAPVFVLGMAVGRGDVEASFFKKLPPPPVE